MDLKQYTSQFPCYSVEELEKQKLNGVQPVSTTKPYDKCFGSHKAIKSKVDKSGGDLFAISFMAGQQPVILADKAMFNDSEVSVLLGFPVQYKGYRAFCYICQFKEQR